MSTACITAVFRYSASKGSARLLLLAMADEANDQGLLTAYRRSQSWLAAKANIDVKSVSRSVKALEELGELVVIETGVGRKSTDYRIELAGIETPQIAGSESAPRGVRPPSAAGTIIPFSPSSSHSAKAEPADSNPRSEKQVLQDRARAITAAVFNARKQAGEPVPANYPAALGVIQQLLKAGWADSDVTAAALAAHTISIGWLEPELRKNRPAKPAPSEFM